MSEAACLRARFMVCGLPTVKSYTLQTMQPNPDFLSPAQMQLFVAGLSGLSSDEVRKAKSLYLRNALSEYRALKTSLSAFGVLQIVFAIIPLFWPILWMQRTAMKAQDKLYRERIANALAVWNDDLGGEAREFEMQLQEL